MAILACHARKAKSAMYLVRCLPLTPKNSGTRKIAVTIPKIEQCGFNIEIRRPKHADRMTNEPPRDKTNKVVVGPAKTQISLGIHPV